MKKYVWSGLAIGLASVLISGSILAATGKIKIIVNGTELTTDTSPKIEDGRVLVPISTISKALSVGVSWDPKSKSVKVDSKPNVLNDDLSALYTSYADARDVIAEYFSYYDSKKDGYQALVTDQFKSDFVDPQKIITSNDEPILDYKIIGGKYNGTLEELVQYKFRVEVIRFIDVNKGAAKVAKIQLDFNLKYDINKGKYLIDGIYKASKEELINSYTVFTGLTFRDEQR
ncbi:copper amine oxidase N-terminal domain-containing protein [Paenibacillus sp. VCA1]|uniref:copper amine oxidase N-terminal domain-containing protein n=1 Tax=Paenibacillus sp. VCA1 TaxID=3039148 RepID=UPI0028711149|nr:copper amine oxidase N-terminal domain-containing protein [Paenibacillus sp. VCA1]MDR9855623.1 copper amine oxidase N-terminal domain-containing protein [Paenibacillus sp. VCA1]